MTVDFKKEVVQARILDPARGFAETTYEIEARTDPLTGKKSYLNKAQRTFPKTDLAPLIQKSVETPCPFCLPQVEQKTPQFVPDLVPEGRLRRGDAWVFPNARLYTRHSALVVLTRQHYIGLGQFPPDVIANGLMAAQDYLRRVREKDGRARYLFLGWNYLPPAGASLVHPHLHTEATYHPTGYQQELLEKSWGYYNSHGVSFWADLVASEKELKERYIGETGSVSWLTSFAPRGRYLDVLALFPRGSLLALIERELTDFSEGLSRVLKYLDSLNFYSFNMTITSGTVEEDGFRAQARLTPRATIGLDTCDLSYHEALQDFFLVSGSPEENCRALRKYFE